MLILAKAILSMMIGFIISVGLGAIIIKVLKKINVKQKLSTYLEKKCSDFKAVIPGKTLNEVNKIVTDIYNQLDDIKNMYNLICMSLINSYIMKAKKIMEQRIFTGEKNGFKEPKHK